MAVSFISQSVRVGNGVTETFPEATSQTIEAALELRALASAFGWIVAFEANVADKEGVARLAKNDTVVTVTLDDGIRAWKVQETGSPVFTDGVTVARSHVSPITESEIGDFLGRNREFLLGALVRVLATSY